MWIATVRLRIVQYKTAIGLHRAAKMHQYIFQFGWFERHVDLRKQFAQSEADRAIHHDAHGALLVVFAHIGKGLGKKWIRHRRHRDQEVIREIELGHACIVICLSANLNLTRLSGTNEACDVFQ